MIQTKLTNRNDLYDELGIKYRLQKNPIKIAAEIGTQRGENAFQIARRLFLEKLYCIDPYIYQEGWFDRANVSNSKHEANYQAAKKKLEKINVVFHKMTSEEAVKNIENRSLDFLYIDGRHDYQSVINDIILWYPKVKYGGIIAGHDYLDVKTKDTLIEVKSAVDYIFYEIEGLEIYHTVEKYPSWWIIKPENLKKLRLK